MQPCATQLDDGPQSRADQVGTDAPTLMAGKNRDRTEGIPVPLGAGRLRRRERDLPHDRPLAVRDQRNGQSALGSEHLDEFRLVAVGIRFSAERGVDDVANRFRVTRALWTNLDL